MCFSESPFLVNIIFGFVVAGEHGFEKNAHGLIFILFNKES